MRNTSTKRNSKKAIHNSDSAKENESTLINKAHNLFQSKIHQFTLNCMRVGGFEDCDARKKGSKEYVSFMSAALESENEWFVHELLFSSEASSNKKQTKIPFSFDPKIDKALKEYVTEYSSLLFECMIGAGYPLALRDANDEDYLKFRALTIDSEQKRLNELSSDLKGPSKKAKNRKSIDVSVNVEAQEICRSELFTTYLYKEDDEKFFLKIANDLSHLQTDHYVDIENELEIAKNINHPGVRKPIKQVTFQNRDGVLMEWIEGTTLSDCGKFQVHDFLIIAREILFALVALHKSRIIHANLSTDHIIVDKKNQRAHIIGLRLASKLGDDDFIVNYFHDTHRDLKFISPEQSGWINHRVDSRSDFYSLGMIFYFMLVGRLPYESDNSLLMTQYHLGKIPESLLIFGDSIPKCISDFVLKLLEKNADNRYQCARGILYDLELMITEYTTNKNLTGIILAENDISPAFFLPQTLYGREAEYARLLSALHRVCSGKFEMIGVTGLGGQGKTFLIEKLSRPIAEQNGIFIQGKYNQSLINEPFSALIQAIEQFCAIVLMADQDTNSFFQARIKSAVKDEGKLLTDVICNLKCIIGEQPRVSSTSGEEAKNRFYYLFFRFLRAICSSRYPVVILLDDIQNADIDSIKLLKMLVNDKSAKYSFFICAFREDEVIDTSLFQSNQLIKVSNLEFEDVNNIIADVLRRPRTDTYHLSAFVYSNTKGNSFFVMQVLLQLKEKGLIKFSFDEYVWKWNESELESISVSDHVIPLLTKKLLQLDYQTINLLKVLSCIGSKFHISLLKLIAGDVSVIHDAVTRGFILPISSDEANYRFSHDYMEQAVHSLIKEDEKKSICFFIGKQLWDKSSSNERLDNLFIVTNLMNSSINLVTTTHDKKNLLQLNFLSGQKAKQSAAFQLAFDYLKRAINLLDQNHWQDNYDFTLKLFNSTAEVAYCVANYNLMNQIIVNTTNNAKSTLHIVDCYSLQIKAFAEQRMQKKAIECGLLALKCLGEQLILSPITDIMQEIKEIKREIKVLNFDLKSLGQADNEYKLAALRILSQLGLIFYLFMPKFLPLIVSKY